MSLYYDAAPLLLSASDAAGSLKSRVFSSRDLKSPPKQVFALVSEASKWSPVLVDVIEKSQLLQLERKLSPSLALLLVHDLLLAKRGVSAPASHPLRLAVERHKARVNAEFTKARLKRGFTSVKDLRASVEADNALPDRASKEADSHGIADNAVTRRRVHPRWVRVNTIKTTLGDQLETTFAGYKQLESLEQLLNGRIEVTTKSVYVDDNIPDLLALSSTADLSKTPAYLNGLIILQDKASCFPAYLLDPNPEDGDIVDACAAPGNKTNHLAAILQKKLGPGQGPKIHACERDTARAATLEQMVFTAGAGAVVTVTKSQDFLRVDPRKRPWSGVGSLLLDPSCSGSGIVGRDDGLRVVLPSNRPEIPSKPQSKKRKRKVTASAQPVMQEPEEIAPSSADMPSDQLTARLEALSTFQLKLLLHAFQFPQARKVVYSTCSIYAEENEHVVMKALASEVAKERGWRILRRDEQISGMKAWKIRGNAQACADMAAAAFSEEAAQACIRCQKDTEEGTQGFFVAALVRDSESGLEQQLLEEEWEGFSDRSHDK